MNVNHKLVINTIKFSKIDNLQDSKHFYYRSSVMEASQGRGKPHRVKLLSALRGYLAYLNYLVARHSPVAMVT